MRKRFQRCYRNMSKNNLFPGYLILLFVFFLASCGQKETLDNVDFEDTIELREVKSFQGAEINICVGSMITPNEGYAYYKRLLDYIGKKSAMKVNFVEKRTYTEVYTHLKNGNIDVAFVCGGPYVKGSDEFGLELLVAPLVGGETVYYSYIIVAANSGIERFEDLRGKTFAFVDPLSNSGRYVPINMLFELNESPQSFFKDWAYTYGHDKSIMAVAQGIVDGAAVDSLIWNYMNRNNSGYTKETKIIKISKPYGIPPVVVRPGLPGTLKIRLKDILLNMHAEEEGSLILEGMNVDRFVEVSDSLYDSIRELSAHIEE